MKACHISDCWWRGFEGCVQTGQDLTRPWDLQCITFVIITDSQEFGEKCSRRSHVSCTQFSARVTSCITVVQCHNWSPAQNWPGLQCLPAWLRSKVSHGARHWSSPYSLFGIPHCDRCVFAWCDTFWGLLEVVELAVWILDIPFISILVSIYMCVCVNFLYLLFSGKSLPFKTPCAMLSHVWGVSSLCCA